MFKRDIDVLSYFSEKHIKQANVVVIQYLISFFYKSIGKPGLINWFGDLVDNLIKCKTKASPMLIIINDVDSINTGRDALCLLEREIESRGLKINYSKRTAFNKETYFNNAFIYPTQRNKYNFPFFITQEKYSVARKCNSIQLIIEVE